MNTNIKKLGFGLMRLPKLEDGSFDEEQIKEMVDVFIEKGFTYFDTAFVYPGSEAVMKKVLVDRYPRDKYTVATKLHAGMASNEEEAKNELTTSLERTGLDYFDFYLLHALDDKNYVNYEKYHLWDFVKEAKEKGLIKHIGFSFHGSVELLEKILLEHPEVEFVQLQINYGDWESLTVQSRKNYEVVRKYGKPIVVMEPVKGGTLANPIDDVKEVFDKYSDASYASWAIRYAASLDGILTVLSGMSTIEQVLDNTSYMEEFKPLNDEEKEVIKKVQVILDSIDSIPCTACHYCTEGCPMEIPIPEIFSARNRQLLFGAIEKGKIDYERAIKDRGSASSCIECGQCESVCPQGINIIERLKECTEVFE